MKFREQDPTGLTCGFDRCNEPAVKWITDEEGQDTAVCVSHGDDGQSQNETHGGTMKTIIAVTLLLCAPLSARAWEFSRNPDRFPSIGVKVSNADVNGTRYESDGPYAALQRTQSGPEHWGEHVLGADVRLPASDCLTFGFAYDHIEGSHTYDRNAGPYQTGGTIYSEKIDTSGYRYTLTARLYFSK
jgi:hypothetical protein